MATANKTTTQTANKTSAPAAKSAVASAPVTHKPVSTVTTQPPAGQTTQALTTVDPALMAMLEQSKGGGFEEAGQDAFATPFLVILQDLSPQTKSLMPGYIEGAKPGNILQSVSKELFANVRVIPCYFSKVFIEWIPREQDGGLVGIHPADTPLQTQITRDEKNRPVLPNGHILEDTRQHYVLFVHPSGAVQQCLIAMRSTNVKVSKNWMASMQAGLPFNNKLLNDLPSYACSYLLGVEERANEQGQWFVWNPSHRELVTDVELFKRAKAFNESVKKGQTRANYEDLRQTEGGGTSGSDVPQDLDNEIDA